jgi:hypothetical protein
MATLKHGQTHGGKGGFTRPCDRAAMDKNLDAYYENCRLEREARGEEAKQATPDQKPKKKPVPLAWLV